MKKDIHITNTPRKHARQKNSTQRSSTQDLQSPNITKLSRLESGIAPESNRALYIDTEAISSLALVQEGLLAPISRLANATELRQDSYLTPFVLNPAGKRNKEVLEQCARELAYLREQATAQPNKNSHSTHADKSHQSSTNPASIINSANPANSINSANSINLAHKADSTPSVMLDIVLQGTKVGYLHAQEIFPIDKKARTTQLTGLHSGAEFDRIYNRLGDYAVCGEYKVIFPDIIQAKKRLQEQIQAHNAKHITGIVLDGQVFHIAHERLLRDSLRESDLVVLFLLKPYRNTLVGYDLQKECLEFAMNHFLLSDRVCIVPLDDTYLFMGTNNVLLHAMVARNYGCTHFVVQDHTPNLSGFYEQNTLHSVLDVIKDIATNIKGDYVYCNICSMLVDSKTCPHGKHHHISYNTESILEFFQAGLMPPSVLVRPEISAKLLSQLYPKRFANIQKLYYDLMPLDEGVLLPKSEEDFYLKLIQLYRIR